jgi:glycosyltransferase involved in cell wall biosynthesis
MTKPSSILIMIPYASDVGFAIRRLIRTFYDTAVAVTGSPDDVHFSFTEVKAGGASALPRDFSNYLAFSVPRRKGFQLDREDAGIDAVRRLTAYVERHEIEQVLGLDMQVGTPYCWHLRQAGATSIVAYWGAPISSLNSGLRLIAKRAECRVRVSTSPNYFIFESEAMRAAAVYGRGVSERRTAVVPTGVDVQQFSATERQTAFTHDLFGIPRDRKIVVFMGHLHKRKGVQTLLGAFSQLVSTGRSDLHLLFLGNRPGESAEFEPLIDERLSSHVTFGGYQHAIPSILQGCYAGCIPSTGWDSFPMSSLEMQACGLPVVVSDLQGVPETMQPGRTGMVVPSADEGALAAAIAELAADPTLRTRMGHAAAEWIRGNFSRALQIERLTEQLGHAYSLAATSRV